MSDTPGPLASPGYWLHHAALRWRTSLERDLKPLGITTTQYIMLSSIAWLQDNDGSPSQQQAADLAGADRMMASRVIRTLVEKGLVKRTPDGSDGRTMRLTLTRKGRTASDKAAELASQTDLDFFGEDTEDWAASLRTVIDDWE